MESPKQRSKANWPDDLQEVSKSILTGIYQLAPVLMITSGRGRNLSKVPASLPFIDFSTLQSTVIPELSKFSLVQIAFSYGLFTGAFGLHYGAEAIGACEPPPRGHR